MGFLEEMLAARRRRREPGGECRRPPGARLRAAAGLLTVLATGLVLLGCGPAEPARGPGAKGVGELPGEQEAELEQVEPPPDLNDLDLAVREQFQEIWRASRTEDAGEAGPAWGRLGQWFDVYGYENSAARCYRNARALDPGEPKWPYYLASLAERAGDLAAAEEGFQAAAALAPRAPAPKVRLGDLALSRQQPERAEDLYREILADDPEDPGALLGMGRLALLRGNAAAALPPLGRLVRTQPEAAQVHYTLGLAWRQLGDEEKAAHHFGRVPQDNLDQIPLDLGSPWDEELRLLDRGARTLTRRGVRAFRRGETGQAAVLLGAAVSADPEGPEKRINYALALRGTGHWAAAEEQLQEALRLASPESEQAAKAHLELGRLMAARGRGEPAAEHLQASLAIDPRSGPAHLELGRLRHAQGRLEEALGEYAAARQAEGSQSEVRFWHAAVLMALGRAGEARSSLEEDLEHLGEDRALRLLLARVASAAPDDGLRDGQKAREELQAAGAAGGAPAGAGEAAAGPDVLYAETAAMVAAEAGLFGQAVAWQRAAVEALAGVKPRSALHTARRRLVLYEQGEPCRTPWEAGEAALLLPVEAPSS